MTTKQFNKIGAELTALLSPCVIHRRLIYAEPLGYVLRGLCFDPSAFSKSAFYVTVFAMPLFVPTDHLAYLLGERLRDSNGKEGWDATEVSMITELKWAVVHQAKPFLEKAASLDGFLRQLECKQFDPHRALSKGFGHVLLKQTPEAVKGLNELLPMLDQNSHWQGKISEQAEIVLRLLERGPHEVQQQLENWRLETISNLELPHAQAQPGLLQT